MRQHNSKCRFANSRLLLLLLPVCIFAIQPVAAEAQQDRRNLGRRTDSLLIKNAIILDVEAGAIGQEPVDVVLSGGTITAISPSLGENSTLPTIDIGGRVLMPGMIDLHSHLLLHPYDEATWNEQVLNESLELRTIRGTVAARKTLEAGFTTLRDLGTEGAGFADVALRDAIKQGIIPGPRVFAVTKAIVTSGGYGPMGFDPRWKMPVGAQVADGVAECRKVTRQQIAAGADWIKIYADYRRRPKAPSTATFSQEELNAIVAEAKSAGVPVAAHATTDDGIRRCIEAGVQTIEHGYAASPETLQLMHRKGVVLCPTLTASESMAVYQGWNPKSGNDHPRITQAKKLIRNAINANVTIACGSDVGVFSHGENVRELELMFAYGMRPDQVIRSTTSLAAKVLQQDNMGLVRTGFVADLIVVDADPTRDLATLSNPLVVIKDGRVAVNKLGMRNRETQRDSIDARSNEMSSGRPQQPSTPDVAKTREIVNPRGTSGFGRTFQFRLNTDGTYTFQGAILNREQLTEKIKDAVSNGKNRVRMVLPSGTNLSVVATEQTWITELGIKSIEIKQEKK